MNFFKVQDLQCHEIFLNLDKVESINPDAGQSEDCVEFTCDNGNTYFYFGTWDQFSSEYPDVYGDTHFRNKVDI